MQAIAALGIAALIIVSIIVAARLLLLHLRTRALPELLLGTMLLVSVGLSYPLGIAAHLSKGSATLLQSGSDVAMAVGFSLLYVFVWRVFRPASVWAALAAGVAVCTLLAVAAYRCLRLQTEGWLDVTEIPLGENLMRVLPVAVAYFWTAFEAFRYHGVMRRRVALGLADATVTNRFLLFALMATFASCGVVLNLTAVLLGVSIAESPGVLLASSFTGGAQTVCMWLAFLPPQAYLDRIRSRSAAEATAQPVA